MANKSLYIRHLCSRFRCSIYSRLVVHPCVAYLMDATEKNQLVGGSLLNIFAVIRARAVRHNDKISCEALSPLWRHISLMTFQINGSSTILFNKLLMLTTEKTSASLNLCEGNPSVPSQWGQCAEMVSVSRCHRGFTVRSVRRATEVVTWLCYRLTGEITQIARFTGPTWGPPGADRTQVGPMLAPWTLLSGYIR